MNVSRDQLRIYLAECNAEQFPLTGHALVDPTNLIKRIEQSVDGGEKMLHITSCSTCDYFAQIQDLVVEGQHFVWQIRVPLWAYNILLCGCWLLKIKTETNV